MKSDTSFVSHLFFSEPCTAWCLLFIIHFKQWGPIGLYFHLCSILGLHLLILQHSKCMRLGIINLTPAYVAVQLKFSSQSGYRPNHGLLIFTRIKCNPICHAYTKAYCSKYNAETQKRNKRTLCWLEHKYVAKRWGVTPAVEQNWHKGIKSQIVAVYKASVVAKYHLGDRFEKC